ncbi:MAG: LppP/LprE family lipoprotein [Dehalococcoidia bacterium]|nr:MAG: LppP/LprE family lipoprotein [Dehalococcoidia bacterium]
MNASNHRHYRRRDLESAEPAGSAPPAVVGEDDAQPAAALMPPPARGRWGIGILTAVALAGVGLVVAVIMTGGGDAFAGRLWNFGGNSPGASRPASGATSAPDAADVVAYHTPVTAGATSAAPAAPAAMTLADAQAVVQQQGYTGTPTGAAWCDACPLHVIIGVRTGTADGYDQRAFFFADHYLGTDTRASSAGVGVVLRTTDTVTLRYTLYNAADATCCPTAGTADVRFRWDGAQLMPLDPIQDNRSPGGPSAAAAPSQADCQWAAYTLHLDAQLDRIGAETYPQWRDFYNRTAGQWDQFAGWISSECRPTWPAQRCTNARDWLAAGISTHETTGGDVPHDPQMDAAWLGNYSRLGRIIDALCR